MRRAAMTHPSLSEGGMNCSLELCTSRKPLGMTSPAGTSCAHLHWRACWHGSILCVFVVSGLAKLVLACQILIVLTLAIIVFGFLSAAHLVNSTVTNYYTVAEPYITEMRERGMTMVRRADRSSEELERMVMQSGTLVSSSVPALLTSLNVTTDMIARMERLARNPTIKVSMGPG